MVSFSIIGFIVFVLVVIVIIKVTKQIAKTLFMASAVLLIVFIVFGFLLLGDVKDFKDGFSSIPSLYLLEDEGVILAGLGGTFQEDSSPSFVSDSELASIQSDFSSDDLSNVKGDNFKLFVIPLSSFDSVILEGDFSQEQVVSLLKSNNPLDVYISSVVSDSQVAVAKQSFMVQSNIADDSEFKSILFGTLLSSHFENEGAVFLFKDYKDNKAIIFPESIVFRSLRFVPDFLIDNFIGGSS